MSQNLEQSDELIIYDNPEDAVDNVDEVEGETEQTGGGETEEEPTAEVTDESEDEDDEEPDDDEVARYLASRGYSVQKPGAPQATPPQTPQVTPTESEELDIFENPDLFVDKRVLKAVEPFVRPIAEQSVVDGVVRAYKELGIDMPEAAIQQMRIDARQVPIEGLQMLASSEAELLRVGKSYLSSLGGASASRQAAQKAVKKVRQEVVIKGASSVPAPSSASSQESSTIPKDRVGAYRSYLEAFGLKDSPQERKSWLAALGGN